MNIDKFVDDGLSLKEINILSKFDKKGYDAEKIYKTFKNYDLRKLFDEIKDFNLRQKDIQTYLTAKELDDKKILDIICDEHVKSETKQLLVKLANATKNWEKFYNENTTSHQLEIINKMINSGVSEDYLNKVHITNSEMNKYKEMAAAGFDMKDFMEKFLPISNIYAYYKAHTKGIDLDYYIKGKNYRYDQIEQIITLASEEKEICEKYKDIIFNEANDPSVMQKIVRITKDGFPVEKINGKKFQKGQLTLLNRIYKFVKNSDIDFEQFVNEKFKTRQLELVYSALLRDFNYKYFMNENYDTKRMENILGVLAYNKINPENILDIEYFTNTKIPNYLLYNALCAMQNSDKKLETKLKFYKKFDDKIIEVEGRKDINSFCKVGDKNYNIR